MPPINRRHLAFAAAWVLFWALMMLASVQEFMRGGQPGLWKPLLWEGSSALVASTLILLQSHATRPLDRYLDQPLRWFGLQALWLPLFWIAFIPLVYGIRHGVYALVGQVYQHAPWGPLFVYESTRFSLFFGLFTAIRFGLKSYGLLLDERLRAEQADALLRQAQLQRLAQQMQPHFLFNALNTISSLMHSDIDRADATLLQLAGMLRATLDLGERQETPLAEDLALARAYAGVMGARFAGRVAIDWNVDDSLLEMAVPALSLQPLLENVFKHTVERRRGLTQVRVDALRQGEALVLRVDDDAGRLAGPAAPADSAGRGIGLANLRARLEALHGAHAALVLSERAGGGVRAELRFPCLRTRPACAS